MKAIGVRAQGRQSEKRKPQLPGQNLFLKRLWKTRVLQLMFLPVLLYYILFKYVPMWGISISLYDYSIFGGMKASEFVGFKHFQKFFNIPNFWGLTRNTLVLGLQSLFISFPVTVLFALLLNEIRSVRFKKVVQTVSYLPHFLSVVIVCGLVTNLLDPTTGAINLLIKFFGGEPIYFITKVKWFRPIYLISEIWQGLGWGTIIYLAAISSVDPAQYEAARLDGAGRWRQMWSITLPSILPTVATMFILKVGNVMDASLEKVLLLQQPVTYEVSQVIPTYIYFRGLGEMDYSFSTAVGLYSSLINLTLLLLANWVSKKTTENSVL